MKAFVILGTLVLAQCSSATTTVVVGNFTTCSSGRNTIVVVKDHGAVESGVRLDFYRQIKHGERSYWTGYTGLDGSLRPTALSPGTYRVFADAGKHDATMMLTVNDSQDQIVTCQMDVSAPERVPQSTIASAPRPTIVLSEFRGVVEDANEAVIPKMTIRLARVHPKGADSDSTVYSDEKGQFDRKLDPGTYIAFFQYQGFRERAVAFDIDAKGWPGFRLTMEVGGSQVVDPLPEEWPKSSKK